MLADVKTISLADRPLWMHENTMRATIHIAVLECDEPVGETKRKYGGFGNIFQELLEAGASRLTGSGSHRGVQLKFSSYDVVNQQEYPDLESVDAVLLSGSSKQTYGKPCLANPTCFAVIWLTLLGQLRI